VKLAWTVAAIVASCAVAAAWLVAGGPAGLVYLLIYAAACLPGLPVGFALFGRSHPAAWIGGAAVGYAITAVALWIPIRLGAPSTLTFLLAWLIVGLTWWFGLSRVTGPCIALRPWRSAGAIAASMVILVTLALASRPLAMVGSRDEDGNRRYRAYFLADFVWHTALTSEVAKFSSPPRNPYLASQPIHYYWTYFLLPAAVSETGPAQLADVERCLRVNALATGVLLLSAVFAFAFEAVGAAVAVAAAVLIALLASSAEGAYELYRLWTSGGPLAALRDVNIDATTAWHFGAHRIDGLQRCLWYVPQHSMAYALGLVALTAAVAPRTSMTTATALLCGIALGGSAAINPFVGAVFAAVWGLTIVWNARLGAPVRSIPRATLAVVPFAAAILWCVGARMVEGAGGVLEIGFRGASTHTPVIGLLLSLGPVLLLALWGLGSPGPPDRGWVVPACFMLLLSLALMYLVRLRVDQEWVPFRAGQMFLAAAPALVARGLDALSRSRRGRAAATALAAAALLIGVPTTVIDAYNAQDVWNDHPGAGFRLTLVLTPDQQQVLAWIRKTTPATAIVQMEPTVRDREQSPGGHGEYWSLIPSFAQRRMAAGLPISLMRVPEYADRSGLVRTMFATADAHEAWNIARRLRIGYIYVDSLDREAYPGASKFDSSPEFFAAAFRRGAAAVYHVR
jgi:hypothetical protein